MGMMGTISTISSDLQAALHSHAVPCCTVLLLYCYCTVMLLLCQLLMQPCFVVLVVLSAPCKAVLRVRSLLLLAEHVPASPACIMYSSTGCLVLLCAAAKAACAWVWLITAPKQDSPLLQLVPPAGSSRAHVPPLGRGCAKAWTGSGRPSWQRGARRVRSPKPRLACAKQHMSTSQSAVASASSMLMS
jgi:hypothetical protein